MRKPWHGVLVANPLALDPDLEIDYDRYAEHIGWLAASGCDGITPNGSLGEYQTLTADERARIVATAMEAAPEGFAVSRRSAPMARAKRCAGPSGGRARRPAVMALPPNAYRADERACSTITGAVAAVGLPVVAYNNPIDTKVDLGRRALARLHRGGPDRRGQGVRGRPRRAYGA